MGMLEAKLSDTQSTPVCPDSGKDASELPVLLSSNACGNDSSQPTVHERRLSLASSETFDVHFSHHCEALAKMSTELQGNPLENVEPNLDLTANEALLYSPKEVGKK